MILHRNRNRCWRPDKLGGETYQEQNENGSWTPIAWLSEDRQGVVFDQNYDFSPAELSVISRIALELSDPEKAQECRECKSASDPMSCAVSRLITDSVVARTGSSYVKPDTITPPLGATGSSNL